MKLKRADGPGERHVSRLGGVGVVHGLHLAAPTHAPSKEPPPLSTVHDPVWVRPGDRSGLRRSFRLPSGQVIVSMISHTVGSLLPWESRTLPPTQKVELRAWTLR